MKVVGRIILSVVIVWLALLLIAGANGFLKQVFTEAGRTAMALTTDADEQVEIARRYGLTVGIASVVPWVLIVGAAFFVLKRVWRRKLAPKPIRDGQR